MKKVKSQWINSYLIVFFITLVLSIICYLLLEDYGQQVVFPILAITMWVPGATALVFAKREKLKLSIFVRPNKYYFIAPLIQIGLVVASICISIPFARLGSYFEGVAPGILIGKIAIGLVMAYFTALTINMIVALGEELYWRGYLWEKLKGKGPFTAMLITGILFGVFHWPVIVLIGWNYPSAPLWGCLMMVVITLALTPVYTYYRLKGKSVLVAAATHGAANASGASIFLFFDQPNTFLVGMTGVTGLVVIVVFSLCMRLYSPATWKKLV